MKKINEMKPKNKKNMNPTKKDIAFTPDSPTPDESLLMDISLVIVINLDSYI